MSGFAIAPVAPSLLEDPVEFLSAEHTRQLAFLSHLERLVRAPAARGAREMARLLIRWLREEMPVHIADEERSLYPRLRPHDAKGILARLSEEHGRDARLAAEVVKGLRRLAEAGICEEGFARAAVDFARLHRHHLEVEEAELAPLARRCLDAAALAELAAEMAARRAARSAPKA